MDISSPGNYARIAREVLRDTNRDVVVAIMVIDAVHHTVRYDVASHDGAMGQRDRLLVPAALRSVANWMIRHDDQQDPPR
jgi:hypothetical protein